MPRRREHRAGVRTRLLSAASLRWVLRHHAYTPWYLIL
jgi:hypothetical protein